MTGNVSKEDQLRDYLLGRLSEEEQKRLERRLLLEDRLFQMGEALARGPEDQAALRDELAGLEGARDEEVAEREDALRAELFDAYARGELEDGDQEWVRRLAESSSQGRERLAFARALREIGGENDESGATTGGRPPREPIRRAVLKIAATVVLISTLTMGYLYWPPSSRPPLRGAMPARQTVEILWAGTRDGEASQPRIQLTATTLEIHLHLPTAAAPYDAFEVTTRGLDDQPIGPPHRVGKSADQTLRFEETVDRWADGVYSFQITALPEIPAQAPIDLGETQIEVSRQPG